MLLVKETHVKLKTKTFEGQIFFSSLDNGRGWGQARRGQFGKGSGGKFDLSHEYHTNFQQESESNRGNFGRSGIFHTE